MLLKTSLLSDVRKDFPQLSDPTQSLVYLDTSATSLKPKCVVETLTEFYSKNYATINRGAYSLSAKASDLFHNTREKARRLIHAKKSEEIIFTKGTTDGINLVASTFGKVNIREGDDVIITEAEHHANFVPWVELCKEKKANLKIIPCLETGELDLDEYRLLLSSSTKLVCITHLSNVLGVLNPIKEMVRLAREFGAYILVDGAQAVTRTSVDVVDLDVDFYVFSSHKIYGPNGVGVLFGKYAHLEAMPPYQYGGDMIEVVSKDEITYQKPPLKFEAGTPNIADVIAFGSALDFIQEVGIESMIVHEHILMEMFLSELKTLPSIDVIGDPSRKTGLISFSMEGIQPLDFASYLDLKQICVRTGHLCAQPILKAFHLERAIRVSFGIYNSERDLDQFFDQTKKFLKLLK